METKKKDIANGIQRREKDYIQAMNRKERRENKDLQVEKVKKRKRQREI